MSIIIENVSRDDIRTGKHIDPGPNSMLIQISDPAQDFPTPKYQFKSVHQFEFLDADDDTMFPEEALISDEQATKLVNLLKSAHAEEMNVIVHCHAGICRSGAVTEVASMMGFTPTNRLRLPNVRVKYKMMRVLGLTYDADIDTTNGETTDWGFVLPKQNDGD
jgi:predicted protein tyrosine phosphatase